MAWSWSHTHEAYANARENVFDMKPKVLAQCYAEWRAHTSREQDEGGFNEKRYRRELRRSYSLMSRGHAERLAEFVWERMEEQATCTNGGWQAWACPFGCGPHLVSFDREQGENQ